jgi:RimJ/RimL family protein N-acetyltransferase
MVQSNPDEPKNNERIMMLQTQRLHLRQWRDEDYPAYARLNADPLVMRYFPKVLSTQESNDQADQLRALIIERGWGVWVLELKASGEFIGITGLHTQPADSGIPHAPLAEIVWRILAVHWGQSYAPEAASRALQFAFEELMLDAVYSVTAQINLPSQRVMTKIGMENTGEQFNHPKLERGHVLEPHCLYVLPKDRWLASQR